MCTCKMSQQEKLAAEQVLYERQLLHNQQLALYQNDALSQLEGMLGVGCSAAGQAAYFGYSNRGIEAAGQAVAGGLAQDPEYKTWLKERKYIKPEKKEYDLIKELSGILFSSQAVEIYKWTSYSILSIIILLVIIFSGQQIYEYISVCID